MLHIRTIGIIALVTVPVIVIICISAVAQEETTVTALDLWYPGAIGSFWTYRFNDGEEVTLTIAEDQMLDTDVYRTIKEQGIIAKPSLWDPFVDLIVDFVIADRELKNFGKINPFLTFRSEGDDQLRGYGKDANWNLEFETSREMSKVGIEHTFLPPDEEWIILVDPSPNRRWQVASFGVAYIGGEEHVAVEGRIGGYRRIETEAGSFATVIVEYSFRKDRSPGKHFCTVWLANIGPVQIEMKGLGKAQLVNYDTAPTVSSLELSYPVTIRHRASTSWGTLKRLSRK